MWKFSKGKDAPKKTEPDNITDSSDTENPDVEEAPSSVEDNVIGKKKFNTKNIEIRSSIKAGYHSPTMRVVPFFYKIKEFICFIVLQSYKITKIP